MSRKKKLYSLYDGDSLVGNYSIEELAERFGHTIGTMYGYIRQRKLFAERYEVDSPITEEQLRRWDEARRQVLGGGK